MIYRFADYCIDAAAFEIRRAGRRLAVEPQVLELLLLLIEQRERIVGKEEIFARIWKHRVVSDAALSSRIKSARRLLGDDGASQRFIRTVYGRGFRFVADVQSSDAPADAPVPAAAEPDTAPPPATRYARSGELHIAYQVFGAGALNLVLVPGFISHIDNYWTEPGCARWLRQFASYARVAMFDKRGTGLSDRVSDLPSMDERLDDVCAVMDAAGFESAALVGISEGGSLASLFAATYPARCLSLVLYGAFARFSSWLPTEESLQQLFDYIRSEWGSGNSLPQFAPSMAGDAAFRQWWGKFERLGANPNAAIALMRMNSRIDISEVLPAIQAPTLVVHRSRDVLIDPQAGDYLAAHIPGARLLKPEGVDHIPWVGGDCAAIGAAIRDFLLGAPPPEVGDRVLATVLAISSADDPDGARDELLHSLLARYRGAAPLRVAGVTVSAFDGPARALRCAQALSAALPGVRIGVHTGEIARGGGPGGPAVEIAREIAATAEPARVLVSRTVTDLVAGSGLSFAAAGECRPVAAAQPWPLYRLLDPAAGPPA